MGDYTEIVENGVTWRVADKYLEKVRNVVIPIAKGKADELPSTIMKENMVRTVYSVGHLVVKTYRIRSIGEALKYLVMPSKAETEWEMSRVLADAGLDSVEAVAYGEKKKGGLLDEAYFACIHLGDVKTLTEKLAGADSAKRKRLAEAAAELTHALHVAGVYHRDLHSGNILVSDDDKLHVIDLHRVSKGVGTRDRYVNLAKLFGPAGSYFEEDEARHGVEHYCKLVGSNNMDRVFERSSVIAEKIHKRHMKSRCLRCMSSG
jgi:tRNA A-37 threonylcarbamoyl transferase component Bud32